MSIIKDEQKYYETDTPKMYILVNNSLHMGKGKVAGQVGHCVAAMTRYLEQKPRLHPLYPGQISLYEEWLTTGETKIILKAENTQQLLEIAAESRIMTFPIHDAGKTQVEANSFTVLGFLPSIFVLASVQKLKLL